MSKLFSRIVYKYCPACNRRFGLHPTECDACQTGLVSVRGLNPKPVLLLASILVAGILAVGWAMFSQVQRARTKEEAALVAQAEEALRFRLQGATADKVDAVAQGIRKELGLTDRQLERALAGAEAQIAALPKRLTPEVARRVEVLLRESYRDGIASSEERKVLEGYASRQRLRPEDLANLERELAPRIQRASRSLTLGRRFVEAERYQEASREFLRATEEDPDNPVAWANLGAAHALAGDGEAARRAYEKALALDPANWVAHYNLGLAAARSGDREITFRHLREALASLPPGSPERRAALDDLLRNPDLRALREDPHFAELLGK